MRQLVTYQCHSFRCTYRINNTTHDPFHTETVEYKGIRRTNVSYKELVQKEGQSRHPSLHLRHPSLLLGMDTCREISNVLVRVLMSNI